MALDLVSDLRPLSADEKATLLGAALKREPVFRA